MKPRTVDTEVKVETGKSRLTLVTCDSFGAKTDRFIVEATLIESTLMGVKKGKGIA